MACVMGLLSATTMYGYNGTKDDGSYNVVIRDFIESHMNANFKKLDAVLGEESTVKIPRGEKVIVQNRSSLVDAMKKEAGTMQNCQSNYEVLAKSDAIVIARVDFSYQDCIQHNYLIVEKDANRDWKITQVCKIFDDLQMPDGKGVIAKDPAANTSVGR